MSLHPRLRTTYTGHVQGVGFRATTASIAQHFPVTGFVQNQADGSVLCEAQGAAADLAAFHAAIRQRLAHRITRETTTRIPSTPGEPDFSIHH
jgi:acylphosphatase